MSNVKQTMKIHKKDWAIILLFLIVIGTNFIWYQKAKYQDITNKGIDSSWLMLQVQINKLKGCIDEGTKPCTITPPQQ